MTLAARRRVAVLVPWLALAAVTTFAILQMRARHAAESSGPVAAALEAAPDEAPVADVADVAGAAHAAEAALDAALLDLEAARAEVSRLRREGAEAAARAETAEALLTVAVARVEALEAARQAAPAVEPVAAPPAAPAPSAGLVAWVADAGADDPARRQRAALSAADATPEQIADLARLRERGADGEALARLAAALPATDATDALVVDLLLEEGAEFGVATRVVQTLGAPPLLRPVVLEALLGRASPGVLKVALGLLSGRAGELGDAERRAALADALAPRLERDEPAQLHAGARAAGLLRLPGLAPRLAALLAHDDGAVRIAAAHALSLVPDLDAVRAEAVKALPSLLLDGSRSVRTAGVLLAEALVGEPVDYDPAGGEAARREALDRILDRLQG